MGASMSFTDRVAFRLLQHCAKYLGMEVLATDNMRFARATAIFLARNEFCMERAVRLFHADLEKGDFFKEQRVA